MALGEFELIGRYFADIVPTRSVAHDTARQGIALGVGDDCALLQLASGQQLAVSADTLVAGVHFPAEADPALVARRALRVNLSDLAAMGAEPLAFTLALTLPAADEAWLAAFAAGLRADAEHFGIGLAGGDTTRGNQLVITIQVMGTVPIGQALTRAGARPGDRVLVSGRLGDAAAALAALGKPGPDLSVCERRRLHRYWLPEPRLSLGVALRGVASAAIDISDGLAADLGHILARSKVGAELEPSRLPVIRDDDCSAGQALDRALHGGDDYELCFTVTPGRLTAVSALTRQLAIPVTDIGVVTAEAGLRVRTSDGVGPLAARGFCHF